VKQVLEITKDHEVHGLVDITGGGLKNIYRMRKGLKYIIDNPVKPSPIFNVIQELGGVEEKEMYKTFNMGMGLTIIAPGSDAEDIVRKYKNADVVGRVEKGSGVLLEPSGILYESY
jgi:phosphoribosylformylglycinamidine cyclo-ligase